MPLETSVSEDGTENRVPEEMAECLPENSSSDEEKEKEWRYQQFRYTVFVHRYDYEVERRNFLHSQSISILSASGVVMTLGLTLSTAPRYCTVPTIVSVMFFIGVVLMSISAYRAIKILCRTYGRREYAAYPSNLLQVPREHSHECLEKTNEDLSIIIQKWIETSNTSLGEMKKGIFFFVLGISFVGSSLMSWLAMTLI